MIFNDQCIVEKTRKEMVSNEYTTCQNLGCTKKKTILKVYIGVSTI
jgi:hypothetical protein